MEIFTLCTRLKRFVSLDIAWIIHTTYWCAAFSRRPQHHATVRKEIEVWGE